MPLLSPNQIQNVLEEVGMIPKTPTTKAALRSILNSNGLAVEDVVDTIRSVMNGADSASTRLKAGELGLKLHGLLENDAKEIPHVTIIIKDNEHVGINPILIPR